MNELAYFNNTVDFKLYAMYNGVGPHDVPHFLVSHTTSVNIALIDTDHIDGASDMFYGYIIFDNTNNKCPLESVSRINPYHFTDETQILYLQNGYDNETNSYKLACKWQFTAPLNYGFKIVVEMFETAKDTFFEVKNRTDLLINEKSVKLYHAIYNSDTYLQVSLNNSENSCRFQAFISVVKNTNIKQDGNCTIKVTETGEINWSTDLNGYMYENNIKCTHDFYIYNGTEAVFDFYYLSIRDTGGDYIGYYDEESGELVKMDSQTFSDGGDRGIKLAPYKNGTTKRVTWEFISDGSFPDYGFKMSFSYLGTVSFF
uniref:CUB domain-containing protein n=1 Tax=Panagrolaimus davidi TaxID=227884 RepID=A0A914QM08_9BILA